MSETYLLDRDGLRPVRFTGTELARDSGSWVRGKDQNRYYDLALYQHEDGRYVAHIQYTTRWQGETDHSTVFVGSTLASVLTDLEDFDPCAWVEGYKALLSRHPDRDYGGYRERQEDLERQIRARYQTQVRNLCGQLGADTAERL